MQLHDITITIPSGDGVSKPVALDMADVYRTEERLYETQLVNPLTANELATVFNNGCRLVSKYISWVDYEQLKAEKRLSLDRATVVLDIIPEEAKKLKDTGLKPNDDWREAVIVRDSAYSKTLDTVNELKAISALLSSKLKIFEKAYYMCYREKDRKSMLSSNSFNGSIGQTHDEKQKNFMGNELDPELMKILGK